MPSARWPVITSLGTAQTLAWASSYYLPAMLAVPISADLGVSPPTVFAAFSVALIVSACVGPYAGRAIDQFGGRPVLLATNVLFAAGLLSLALAHTTAGLFAAWALLGVAMGAGLYEAAFAAIVRLWGRDSRGAITGVTLIAGFASTVGWPLTTLLESQFGWRGACVAWAGLHLFVGMPLNALVPRASMSVDPPPTGQAPDRPIKSAPQRAALLLAFVFAATWFISTAMAAHLPQLLLATGATLTSAVLVGALVGPAQVAGRIFEFTLLRRVHPLLSARLAALLHPLGAIALITLGAPAAVAFGLLHGAGNGILTIAKGTLPLVLFGPQGYGQRQGLLMVPARVAQALAPWLFGLCLAQWGVMALALTGALGALAFLSLLLLPKAEPASNPPD